ncbi:phosphoribosylanthranilate isomerase [Horticoccus luteus]|uniref:N-(5'-phosphoribosyl)anthranilate isomerase n=1 Tax=Horticoccus luteus TaxID=2862869 RepID=A0A8F9XK17_9BACT|nr:phosphoribosylanthranilate isomerase [Horticoccus luteus]
MIAGVRVKVCGLTSLVDAEDADACGVDYLGFNLYPKSPRFVTLAQYAAMRARLPDRRKVAVCVEPSAAELVTMTAAGFDYFQIHFRHDVPVETVAAWAKLVGPERLWLAPKLPPQFDVPAALLPFAKGWLLDTFQVDGFGGSGRTSDWAKFGRHQAAYPEKFWMLSGGLSPENIGAALRATQASFVDVNSGIESAPGVKDLEKLKRFAVQLREAVQALK